MPAQIQKKVVMRGAKSRLDSYYSAAWISFVGDFTLRVRSFKY